MKKKLQQFKKKFEGELYLDDTCYQHGQLLAYSTDAPVYQEKPLVVAIPKSEADIVIV